MTEFKREIFKARAGKGLSLLNLYRDILKDLEKVEEKLRPAAERKASAPPPSQSLPYFFP